MLVQISVKGKNLEVPSAVREYADKKVAKIQRYFERGDLVAEITVGAERGLETVDTTIQVNGLLLRGEASGPDVYTAIDESVDRIERQIRKYKTRINRKFRQMGANVSVAAIEPEAPEARDERAEPAVELRIVRTKRFAVKPMSVEEAVMQMELLGHDFYVFSNAETEEVNVVYRRKGGGYGLIEPEF